MQPDYASVRNETIALASGLLLGPMAPDEVLSSAPVDTYLTGILWPEAQPIDALEDDQADGAADTNDNEADAAVPGYRLIRPCSIGFSFATDSNAVVRIRLSDTARYEMIRTQGDTGGAVPQRSWARRLLDYSVTLPPGPSSDSRTSKFTREDGTSIEDPSVILHIRRRIRGDEQVLTVTLINAARETNSGQRDELCLMQAGLVAEAVSKSGLGLIRPRKALPLYGSDEDAESAALLYRDVVEFAVGHGIAAAWSPPERGRVERVWTTWLPMASVKGMSARGHALLSAFLERHPDALSASWLSRPDARVEVVEALTAFVQCYRDWIATVLAARLDKFQGDLYTAANRNLQRCTKAADRIARGVETLETSSEAWRAFVLANSAMDRQARFAAKGEGRGPLTWRPFQLAYMLLVLPGLVDGDDPERECVDLLWFPTGGGKTEAYLALTAFQLFFRRLTDAGRRDHGGVDVIMRYTLRLLTVQQFQRAASLICACDAILRESGDLGEAPITLGLYVGGEATPNRIAEAHTALAEEHNDLAPRSTPRQLLNCPVCGSDLPPSCYAIAGDRRGITISCRNPSCETQGRPLPVLTVDDLIYEAPPSLVIGTIDKFAQLPRRSDLRPLFGLDGGLRPGLIIQDELHLISGPLGSIAGLYETAIDLLCTDNGRRPKVIGSTATIGQAARQVRALFDRPVLQFPPSGFDASDSFYAVRDEDGPDRIYVGVSSAGRSPKFALQAGAAAFLEIGQHLLDVGRDRGALDAFWTAVLYFNSLRELGGAHVLMQDDVRRHIEFLAARLGSARRPLEAQPIELSSRVPSRDLPEYLKSLDQSLQASEADPFAPPAQDTVLASNMISVGVDVRRLGLMIVNGQPKSTAEYIQATSRVGRGIPGLVVTLYNFGRPRDVSHFEHFSGYHAALYRGVEATSVTPWAPRARDKALHAVFAACVRHLVSEMAGEDAAINFDANDAEVAMLVEAIAQRAASASEGVEGADAAADLGAIVQEWGQRVRNSRTARKRLVYWKRKAPYGQTQPHLMRAAEEGGRAIEAAWPTPNSMREVEPSTAFVLKRLGRE
jgi:hypothetical protein